MTQPVGREVITSFYDETTYNVVPGSPALEKMYFISNGVAGTIARIMDETLSGYRGEPVSVPGQTTVSGDLPCNMAPQSICRYLKHHLGYTAGTNVFRPAVATGTMAGVEVMRASSNSVTAGGVGTLTFAVAGTTLTWAEPSDTAGTPVNVSAGGDFTLASANGHTLLVRVTAGALPVSNGTLSVTVAPSTAFEHVFSPQNVIPEGFGIEVNYGTKIPTANQWLRINGNKFVKGKFVFKPSGLVAATFSVTGASFTNTAGAALGSVNDYGHQAFSMFSATLYEGGTTIGTVTELDVNTDNDADDGNYTIGAGGVLGSLPLGFFKVTGSVKALFTDASLLNKALTNTASQLKIAMVNGTGLGTPGNEAIIFRIPDMIYTAKTPTIDGPKGLNVMLDFTGNRPIAAESRFEVVVRNQRSSI